MKRHGGFPKLAPLAAKFAVRQRRFGQPIMEMVNETFGPFAASSPFFRRRVAPIKQSEREFRGPVRPYGFALLTMIKIVLIAAISFEPLSQ
jgi:hypothetical protein